VCSTGETDKLINNEDVKEFYLGMNEVAPEVVPRYQALQAAQTLALLR